MYNFYALDYDSNNLGDWIQSLAQIQMYPYYTHVLNRDSGVITPQNKQPIMPIDNNGVLIFNAWTHEQNWINNKSIYHIKNFLPISIHLSSDINNISSSCMSYLQSQEIGARDYQTLDKFSAKSIKCFFSGCLTLLLRRNSPPKLKSNKIIINEIDRIFPELLTNIPNKQRLVKPSAIYKYGDFFCKPKLHYLSLISKYIDRNILKNAIFTTHDIDFAKMSYQKKLSIAMNALNTYSDASLVITTRLHTALPCLALGVPVVFIYHEKDIRFGGLLKLFGNSFMSVPDFKKNRLDLDHSHLSPDYEAIKSTQKILIDRVQNFYQAIGISHQNDYYENYSHKYVANA